MKMFKVLALVCAVWVAFLPTLCLAQQNAVGSDGDPTARNGMRQLGSDGTSDRKILTDASGRLDVLTGYPSMEVLSQVSNKTLATGANDSTLVPFPTLGYRQLFALVRIKAASFAATSYLDLAVRGCASAQFDSTALGWYYPLGTGQNRGLNTGKTIRLTDLRDRWKMIPLTDSLTNTPFQAPYMAGYLGNFTGAQVIFDLWYLGVR